METQELQKSFFLSLDELKKFEEILTKNYIYNDESLQKVTDEDLQAMGIIDETDRKTILQLTREQHFNDSTSYSKNLNEIVCHVCNHLKHINVVLNEVERKERLRSKPLYDFQLAHTEFSALNVLKMLINKSLVQANKMENILHNNIDDSGLITAFAQKSGIQITSTAKRLLFKQSSKFKQLLHVSLFSIPIIVVTCVITKTLKDYYKIY